MSAPENTLQRRIAPGIWIDANGDPHWSIPELLELADLPDTPETRVAVVQMLKELLQEHHPWAKIIERPDPPADWPG